jgi:hypothetical protein
MTTYTNVFTGSTIYPAEVSLTKLDLISDIQLYWPQEGQPNNPVVSKIIEIDSATGPNLSIIMPPANLASLGETVLFNNRTGFTVLVKDITGTLLISVAANTQWQTYLNNNTTPAGVWRSYQFGATTSNANAALLAGLGIKAIGSTLNQSMDSIGFLYSFALADSDRSKFYNWQGAGAGVEVTLTDSVAVGSDWYMQLRNSGDNSINVICLGSDTINGNSNLVFQPEDSAFICSDGAGGFFTIGLGQNPVFAFDYTVVDVTGAVDYVLSGSELNRIAYQFIGVMGDSFSVVIPATVQQYWVYNNTDASAFNLSIKAVGQISPLLLVRGDRVLTYCDGTDVVPVQSSPVTGIVDGGTF